MNRFASGFGQGLLSFAALAALIFLVVNPTYEWSGWRLVAARVAEIILGLGMLAAWLAKRRA